MAKSEALSKAFGPWMMYYDEEISCLPCDFRAIAAMAQCLDACASLVARDEGYQAKMVEALKACCARNAVLDQLIHNIGSIEHEAAAMTQLLPPEFLKILTREGDRFVGREIRRHSMGVQLGAKQHRRMRTWRNELRPLYQRFQAFDEFARAFDFTAGESLLGLLQYAFDEYLEEDWTGFFTFADRVASFKLVLHVKLRWLREWHAKAVERLGWTLPIKQGSAVGRRLVPSAYESARESLYAPFAEPMSIVEAFRHAISIGVPETVLLEEMAAGIEAEETEEAEETASTQITQPSA